MTEEGAAAAERKKYSAPGPVRPGEELPWDRLEVYLGERLGVLPPMVPLQFLNGAANLTYLLKFKDTELVLRRPPFGELAPGSHSMEREFRVLSRLWRGYRRAPRAFDYCADTGLIGSEFVIAERRDGEVMWAELPESMREVPNAAVRIGNAVIDALIDLHLTDPSTCELENLGRPGGFVDRQLDGWSKRWKRVESADVAAEMQSIEENLRRLRPRSQGPVILHNDFKIDNCMLAAGDPDRVTTVLDWDQTTLGDPLIDLGIALNYWPDPSDSPSDVAPHLPGLELVGLPSRSDVVNRYAEATGFDVSAIRWYEAFASWKIAIIREQLYFRYQQGESTDPRMGLKHDNVPLLANRALRLLGEYAEQRTGQ